MSPKVGTGMGKLSLVAGTRQEWVTNMAAVQPAQSILRKRTKESLYIILDVTGEPSGRERIYRELIRIIGQEYFQAPGSITSKLRRAIEHANSFLLHENLKSLPHEQRAGGLTCTVLREETVYIAQVGPTTAYVSYQGMLMSFPERPVTELTAEEATPLGFKRGMPIRFYRTKVGIGGFILLTAGSLAQQTSPQQIAQAVVGKDMYPALASLEELAGDGDASAMIIQVAPGEERLRVQRQALVRRPVRPGVQEAPMEQPTRLQVEETPVDLPTKHKVEETPVELPIKHKVEEAPVELPIKHKVEEAPVELPIKHKVEEAPVDLPTKHKVEEAPVDLPIKHKAEEAPVERLARPRVKEALKDRLARPKVEETPKERPARPRVKETPKRQPARPRVKEALKERLPRPDWDSLKSRVSSALTNTLEGAADFLKRLLPGRVVGGSPEPVEVPAKVREEPSPKKRAARPRQSSRTSRRIESSWRGIAIAAPVVIIILVIVVYWRQATIRQASFNEFVTQAQQQMDLVQQVDEATARGHLLEALNYLAKAEELTPGNPQVNDLREQTDYVLKKIDKVTVLDWIAALWEYGEPDSDPSLVIIEGIDIYVLDKGLDRVYKHLLDDSLQALQQLAVDPVLLRKGDQRDPIVVGELVDMAWAKAEGGRLDSNLLVLESGGSLLEYDPEGGINVLPVGGNDRWIQPQIAASYHGDFYLLDSSLNQILRHEPDYASLPEGYFAASEEVDLTGAVDMVIVGEIYVLYADGRILKFLDGQPAPFEITGLYEPLQNPTALFTSEETEFLYVADAGNKRIVRLTKEGHFVRQFQASQSEAFTPLKGLFVSETYNRLYFVSGNKLYVTNVPSEE